MNSELLNLIPQSLKHISGSVFYSGQDAFKGNKPLYILGLNPGGSPIEKTHLTLDYHTSKNILKKNWSEYRDVKWGGKPPGTSGLQPRVLHLLKELNLNPSDIPASNIVFNRSRNTNGIKSKFNDLANLCWPFHKYVIESQKIKGILCFGKLCGNFVRKKLKANKEIGRFEERNKRKWKTLIYSNNDGVIVIVATHPSRADWTNSKTDPSNIIKRIIN